MRHFWHAKACGRNRAAAGTAASARQLQRKARNGRLRSSDSAYLPGAANNGHVETRYRVRASSRRLAAALDAEPENAKTLSVARVIANATPALEYIIVQYRWRCCSVVYHRRRGGGGVAAQQHFLGGAHTAYIFVISIAWGRQRDSMTAPYSGIALCGDRRRQRRMRRWRSSAGQTRAAYRASAMYKT